MDTKTSIFLMDDSPITFRTSNAEIPTKAKDLTLELTDDEVIACRMTFVVDYATYEIIDDKAHFYLDPEDRNPTYGGSLKKGQDVEIEVAIDTDYLPYLLKQGDSAGAIARYLKDLSAKKEDHVLLNPNTWYAWYVKQVMEIPPELAEDGAELKVGYSTIWANSSQLEEDEEDEAGSELFTMLKNFYRDEGWEFAQVEEQKALKLPYEGEHSGEWTCYARANPDYAECSFYSVYPETIPEKSRPEIMEYITRANFGLPVGNFELNLDTGEVRFKTSIDFEDALFSSDLLSRLTYVNVTLMDKYSVGLNMILKDGKSITEALKVVEG